MITFDEIKSKGLAGDYTAITESGRRYAATYVTKYGGCMFYCIPSDEVIIGYEPKEKS